MNVCYQVNAQKLMDVLDDFIKIGKDGRRRKRKLKYASNEATFDFQGDVLAITYNEKTVEIEAKGRGRGCAFVNWKLMAYITSYEKNQESLTVWVEDNLFHLETISVPCKWMDISPKTT
jgi:hypothetical protein